MKKNYRRISLIQKKYFKKGPDERVDEGIPDFRQVYGGVNLWARMRLKHEIEGRIRTREG